MKKNIKKMNEKERLYLLDMFNNMSSLKEKHFFVLKELSKDKDSYIRSEAAALLINFESNQSKNILLRLAKDNDSLVRTEAYDSLKVFPLEEVEEFLKNAICREKNQLARSYAIMSWAIIVRDLYEKVSEKHLTFMRKQMELEKGEHCLLEWMYAEYIWGEEISIQNILAFLDSKDSNIRCCVVNTLKSILHEDNEEEIHNAMKALLRQEKSIPVIGLAEELLCDIEN